MSGAYRMSYEKGVETLLQHFLNKKHDEDGEDEEIDQTKSITSNEQQQQQQRETSQKNKKKSFPNNDEPEDEESNSDNETRDNKNAFDKESKNNNSKAPQCIGESCRRRSQLDCVHKMCFLCCYYARKIDCKDCEVHHQQTLEREREDRYIEEGLAKKVKKAKLPHFAEERFTDVGQTIVIFCLKDFLLNRK